MSADRVEKLVAEEVVEQVAADPEAARRDLADFDDIRRVRNKTEYDALIVTQSTAMDALAHARAIVDAIETDPP